MTEKQKNVNLYQWIVIQYAVHLIKIAKHYRVALTVHDSIVCCVKEDDAEQAKQDIEMYMRWVPDWAEGLPLDCEAFVGRSYGECE